MQIVRNRALSAVEAGRLRGRASEELARAGASEAGPTSGGERARRLAALEQITPVQREVVLLHGLDGWTHPEIAEALGISEVGSRQHLFQARRALRGILDGQDRGTS